MSGLLLGGMGLPEVADTTPGTGLSIREQILEHLVAALQTVRRLSTPLGWENNTSARVTAASGGAYTGLYTRCYRVRVVVGGASGTAKVTVTDVTVGGSSPDDGPTAVTVTTGSAIAVGSLGVTITFTMPSGSTLVLGNYWDVYAGPYQSDITGVTRQEDEIPEQPTGVWARLLEPVEQGDDQPIGWTTKSMMVSFAVQINVQAEAEKYLEKVLADCEKAVLADHTRGGIAIDTTPQTNDAYARDELAAYSGFTLVFEVLYRHRRGDPYTQ